jgi:hypothetical protein
MRPLRVAPVARYVRVLTLYVSGSNLEAALNEQNTKSSDKSAQKAFQGIQVRPCFHNRGPSSTLEHAIAYPIAY